MCRWMDVLVGKERRNEGCQSSSPGGKKDLMEGYEDQSGV